MTKTNHHKFTIHQLFSDFKQTTLGRKWFRVSVLSGMTLTGLWWVVAVGRAQIYAFFFFGKELSTCVLISLVPHCKNCGELWARLPVLTPVSVQATTAFPVADSSRRVRLPRNLRACFDFLVRVLRHSWEGGTHVGLPGPRFKLNENRETIRLLCPCLETLSKNWPTYWTL